MTIFVRETRLKTHPTFRLVHAVTDPFLGDRLCIGALVWPGAGSIVPLVRVRSCPWAIGHEMGASLNMLREDLLRYGAASYHQLPDSMGALATLADCRDIPTAAGDGAITWVRGILDREST